VGPAVDIGEELPTLDLGVLLRKKVRAVITIRQWTGLEASLLRTALRLSIRDFAAKLGVDIRTVTKWQARGTAVVLRPHMQEVMDTVLQKADDHARARFTDILRGNDARPGPYTHLRQSGSVRNVNRQQFLRASGMMLALPWAELFAPTEAAWVPAKIGSDHIAQLRQVTGALSFSSNAHGGELAREAAFAQLRWSAQLLHADCPEALRPDLFAAVAHLASVAGFMAVDADAQEDGRRAYRFGLACADESGNQHAQATLLGNMALQATWTGRPDDGVTCSDKALAHADRLPAAHHAKLHTIRARALAKMHLAQETLTAVGAGDDVLASDDNAEEPLRWTGPHDQVWHQALTGHALVDLAIAGRKTQAGERLAYAVAHDGQWYARLRVTSRVKQATLLMATGDPREGAAVGNTALDEAGTIRSRRVMNDLRTLQRFAGRHPGIDEVVELERRVGEVIGAS
jgi:hypothetical protein